MGSLPNAECNLKAATVRRPLQARRATDAALLSGHSRRLPVCMHQRDERRRVTPSIARIIDYGWFALTIVSVRLLPSTGADRHI